MAGLTKERAQREAEKLAAEQVQNKQQQQEQQQGIELVVMVRDFPEFPGPLSADVHPDEVDNWLALDWRLEE
jgi:hypothetical protein